MTYIRQLISGLRQNSPDTPRYIKAKDELQLVLAAIGIAVVAKQRPIQSLSDVAHAYEAKQRCRKGESSAFWKYPPWKGPRR